MLSFLYLAVGLIVRGIGAPAVWTILPAHIEEVLDRSSSSLYIGIYQSILLVLSPALAFVIGKPLLSQWVDIFQVNLITCFLACKTSTFSVDRMSNFL